MKRRLTDILTGRRIIDVKSVMESQAFCIKPWVHLFVSQYGSVVPCCLTPWDKDQALGDINKETIQEIWNGSKMKEFRSKLLKDKKDSRCHQCYQSEKVGLKSTRTMTNALYSHKIDWVNKTKSNGFTESSKPIFWDIRISNLCNFKCRICGHHSSSQWYNDAKAMGIISHETKIHRGPKDYNKLLSQLEFVLPELEEIYFAGGEPLILDEHYQVLELLLERGLTNVKLRYATNFSQTIYKGVDVFEKWAQFKNVHVHASLDGSGKQGEFQRKGQSWEEVISNRKRMKIICPNVEFLLTPTISVYNIFNITKFHQEWVINQLCNIDEFMPHTLRGPEFLNLTILPLELKKFAEKLIENHIIWIKDWASKNPPLSPSKEQLEQFGEQFEHLSITQETEHLKLNIVINEFKNCITFMNSVDKSNLLPEFIAYNKKLDSLRDEKTSLIIPELSVLFQTVNSNNQS